MSDLCYIKTKHSLKRRHKQHKIINAIKEKITSIHDYQSLKNNGFINPELVLMVCNCVENSIKKHAGVDKKEFVVEVLNDLFHLSPPEADYVREQCQHNFDNNLIELIPFSTKLISIFWNYIKRKIR
jgi:hypothetical protein